MTRQNAVRQGRLIAIGGIFCLLLVGSVLICAELMRLDVAKTGRFFTPCYSGWDGARAFDVCFGEDGSLEQVCSEPWIEAAVPAAFASRYNRCLLLWRQLNYLPPQILVRLGWLDRLLGAPCKFMQVACPPP